MDLERLEILQDQSIQEFIAGHTACAFNTPAWYRVLEDGFNTKVAGYCLKDNAKINLILPGVLLDFKIIKMFYSNIPYGGFIGDKGYVPDFLLLLERKLKQEGIHILRFTKRFEDNYLDLNGYKLQKAWQQIINTGGLTEQGLWQRYKSRVRRDIRRAEKLGVRAKVITQRSEIEILYQLYRETMKRNSAHAVWSKKALYSIYDNLVSCGNAQVFFGELNNKYISGIILIYAPDTAYYFLSASATGYLTYGANDLLLHQAIVAAIRKNMAFFDLMTSSESDRELIQFKEKWGAEKYPFFILEKSLNKTKAYIWRAVWRVANTKLGSSLARKLVK